MKDRTVAKRKYFTLIELLIVIAIIAILASMLLPAISSARDRAKGINCISNQKQCVLATTMYMDDFNGWMTFYPDTASGTRKVWAPLLIGEKYLSKLRNAECPKFASVPGWSSNEYHTYAATIITGFKYAALGKTMPNKVRPSELFLLGDGIDAIKKRPWLRMTNSGSSTDLAIPVAWHSGRIAFGFYDGHAATVGPFEIKGSGNLGTNSKNSVIHQYFYNDWGGYWYNFSQFLRDGRFATADIITIPNS